MEATNQLLKAACQHFSGDNATLDVNDDTTTIDPSIVLQDSVYRVALSMEQQSSLQDLARKSHATLEPFHVFCQWIPPAEMDSILDSSFGPSTSTTSTARPQHFGALKLSGNAKVIHVPSYLCGLWKACLHLSHQTAQWILTDPSVVPSEWLERLNTEFDIVILAAGAGLFRPEPTAASNEASSPSRSSSNTSDTSSILSSKDFPIQLVRGQSAEMQRRVESPPLSHAQRRPPALVCGKYVLPTLQDGRILVGATHEFQSIPWACDQILDDLRERTVSLLPSIWNQQEEDNDDDWEVAQISSGMRVQTNRIRLGRLPIIGHLHSNVWIFTGLSGRGLLYHALFGDYLTDSILQSWKKDLHNPQLPQPTLKVPNRSELFNWWKKRSRAFQ